MGDCVSFHSMRTWISSLGGSFQNHYAEFTPDGKHIIVVDIGGSVKNEKQSGYLHTLK